MLWMFRSMGDSVTCSRQAFDKRYDDMYITLYVILYINVVYVCSYVCASHGWCMVQSRKGSKTNTQPVFLASTRLGTVVRRRLGGGPCRCKSVWPCPPSRSWQTTDRLADRHGSSTAKWWESGDWRRVSETKTGTLGVVWTQYHTYIQFKEPEKKLYTCIMYHMKSIRANVKSTLIDSHSEDVSCLAGKYSTLSSMFEVAFPTVRIVLNCEVFCKTFDPPFADRRLCDFWHCFRCKSSSRCWDCPGSCFLWWLCPEARRSAAEIHGYRSQDLPLKWSSMHKKHLKSHHTG